MIQTLPLVLFIVLSELTVGSFGLLYVLDVRNEVKRSFLVLYGILYLFLAALTLLFQQGFSSPALLDTFTQLDKAWIPYETPTLVLFLVLLIPYNIFLWMDKKAGVALVKGQPIEVGEGSAEEAGTREGKRSPIVRTLRLVSGGTAVLAGVATIAVMALIYRPLNDARLGGAFTVAEFFAASLTIGGVMPSMWLGHWYLVTPALTEKPLLFSTTIVLLGVLLEVIFYLATGAQIAPAQAATNGHATPIVVASPTVRPSSDPTPSATVTVKPANVPTVTPLSIGAIGWLRILVGFAMPLILGGLAWKLVRDRSFQSATGMLYLIVVCALAGEILARGLFLMGLS